MKKRTMHRPSKDVTVPTRKVGMDARIRHQAMTVRAPYRADMGPQTNRAKMVARTETMLEM